MTRNRWHSAEIEKFIETPGEAQLFIQVDMVRCGAGISFALARRTWSRRFFGLVDEVLALGDIKFSEEPCFWGKWGCARQWTDVVAGQHT